MKIIKDNNCNKITIDLQGMNFFLKDTELPVVGNFLSQQGFNDEDVVFTNGIFNGPNAMVFGSFYKISGNYYRYIGAHSTKGEHILWDEEKSRIVIGKFQ